MVIIFFTAMMLLFVAMVLMYALDEQREHLLLFGFIGMTLMLMAMGFGDASVTKREYKYKKKPIVHIECNGSKCDTTYIYKF